MNTRSRIEKLEATTDTSEPPIIVRRFVIPGSQEAPMVRMTADDGEVFIRESGEDDSAFTGRAARAAGWPGRTVRLVAGGV